MCFCCFLTCLIFFTTNQPCDSTKAGQRQKEVIKQVNVKLINGFSFVDHRLLERRDTKLSRMSRCHIFQSVTQMCSHVGLQMLVYTVFVCERERRRQRKKTMSRWFPLPCHKKSQPAHISSPSVCLPPFFSLSLFLPSSLSVSVSLICSVPFSVSSICCCVSQCV